MKPSGKECVTIRSALAVVSVNPPTEEHDVLRTCLRVGPAVSERLCSRGEVSSSGKILWPFEGSSYRKVRRGRLLLFLKFFCKTMLPHQGYSRPENPKRHGFDSSIKLSPLQNYGIMNLQNHGDWFAGAG